MTDIVDQQTRSRMMAGIKGRNTKPELELRRALHARGFRYRLHSKKVHGRPDLVLPKRRAVVFVHGCFWHRHEGCRYATTPATRAAFWQAKFEANVARDSAVHGALLEAGWRVATIWECALRKPEQVAAAVDQLSRWLLAETDTLELGEREVLAPHEKSGMSVLPTDQFSAARPVSPIERSICVPSLERHWRQSVGRSFKKRLEFQILADYSLNLSTQGSQNWELNDEDKQ